MVALVNHLKRVFLGLLMTVMLSTANAAPDSEILEFWNTSNESNTAGIDHSDWQTVLGKYVDDKHPSGVNRFDYGAVSKNKADKKLLDDYLLRMQKLDPRKYNRAVQFAYWVNMYNALTVKLIVDNYPVETITDLGESFFGFGPWNDNIASIQGQDITLNNIEHNILRPIWNDNRIHYAVNCASYGCPNLVATAFTAENTEALLEQGAIDYINHPRGVQFDDGELLVSSIFHWYKVDFGDKDSTLIAHFRKYAKPELLEKLKGYDDDIDHDYDWSLNQP